MTGQLGKLRSPLGVIVLSIITLGIYGLYWQYASFREMRQFSGKGVGGIIGLILGIFLFIVNMFLMPSEVGALYTPAAHPHRQPAHGGSSLSEHEHFVLVHLDENLGVGMGQVDAQAVRLLDLPADQHAQLRRRQAEALVPAPCPDGEGAGPALGQRDRGGGDRLGRLDHPERLADPGDAGYIPDPFGDRGRGLHPAGLTALLAVGDAEQDDPLALAQLDRHAEVPDRGADVALQDALELLPVPPFEHDLAQLEQDARLVRARPARGLRHPTSVPACWGQPEVGIGC